MKKKIYVAIMLVGLISVTSCAKDEECVCTNTGNITESDAKDVGVSLEDACSLAKTADATCNVE